MAVEDEVLVIHPHRMVEIQRAVGQLLAKLRYRLDAERQRVTQQVEGIPLVH
jgi:hypothetical protein